MLAEFWVGKQKISVNFVDDKIHCEISFLFWKIFLPLEKMDWLLFAFPSFFKLQTNFIDAAAYSYQICSSQKRKRNFSPLIKCAMRSMHSLSLMWIVLLVVCFASMELICFPKKRTICQTNVSYICAIYGKKSYFFYSAYDSNMEP